TGQLKPLQATAPDVLARFSDRQFLRQHGSQITGIVERTAGALAGSLENVGWLLMVPIAAAFVLIDRARLFDRTIDLLARGRDREGTRRTVEQIDATLAQYARAQLTVAGLSAAFYAVSAAALGFPYAIPLGVLGGVLEFLPAIGWVLASAIILAT